MGTDTQNRRKAKAHLTPSEIKVLKLVMSCSSYREVADKIRRDERTVHFHIGNVFNALNVKSAVSAIIAAYNRGFLTKEDITESSKIVELPFGVASLTKREREIAVVILRHRSSQALADELIVSKRTVDGHIGEVYSKLNISSRPELLRVVLTCGFLSKKIQDGEPIDLSKLPELT